MALQEAASAAEALGAWWNGAFGSWYSFVSSTLVRATPLALTGCAVALAFRGGVLNIGAEGQLLVGAACAAAVSLQMTGPAALVIAFALLAGVAGGAGWAAIAAWLRSRFNVLEVISTIMLNFVAAHAVGWLVRGPLQEHLHIYPQTETIAPAARLPIIVAGTRLHAGFAIAVIACVAAWFALRSTASGFRLRVVGASPTVAASAGLVRVNRGVTWAFVISGGLAGLAGASEVQGVTYALYENLSPGYGFTAIAVALLARLNPLLVIPSAIFFGALEAGAAAMQRDAGVPSVVVSVVEALVILGVLAIAAVRSIRVRAYRTA